ncbi:hypothetical protein [Pseudomonas corrugata]|uniref:hypothetical protein n=1 Tax=Pseudomonas corrugata TaxID=47879 RepID=UPI0037094BF1
MKNNNSLLRHIPWLLLAVAGACALGVVALRRGEPINALWIVVAAVAIPGSCWPLQAHAPWA